MISPFITGSGAQLVASELFVGWTPYRQFAFLNLVSTQSKERLCKMFFGPGRRYGISKLWFWETSKHLAVHFPKTKHVASTCALYAEARFVLSRLELQISRLGAETSTATKTWAVKKRTLPSMNYWLVHIGTNLYFGSTTRFTTRQPCFLFIADLCLPLFNLHVFHPKGLVQHVTWFPTHGQGFHWVKITCQLPTIPHLSLHDQVDQSWVVVMSIWPGFVMHPSSIPFSENATRFFSDAKGGKTTQTSQGEVIPLTTI